MNFVCYSVPTECLQTWSEVTMIPEDVQTLVEEKYFPSLAYSKTALSRRILQNEMKYDLFLKNCETCSFRIKCKENVELKAVYKKLGLPDSLLSFGVLSPSITKFTAVYPTLENLGELRRLSGLKVSQDFNSYDDNWIRVSFYHKKGITYEFDI
jgi:hypothetical protein